MSSPRTERTIWSDTPERGLLLFVLVVLLASYGGTWVGSPTDAQRMPIAISPGGVWVDMLGDANGRRAVFATIELRDGRRIDGQVASYTWEQMPTEQRDIALARPLQVRSPPDGNPSRQTEPSWPAPMCSP
jgi:Family of unknown function (DUF6338)